MEPNTAWATLGWNSRGLGWILYFRAEPEQERRMFVHVYRRKQLWEIDDFVVGVFDLAFGEYRCSHIPVAAPQVLATHLCRAAIHLQFATPDDVVAALLDARHGNHTTCWSLANTRESSRQVAPKLYRLLRPSLTAILPHSLFSLYFTNNVIYSTKFFILHDMLRTSCTFHFYKHMYQHF